MYVKILLCLKSVKASFKNKSLKILQTLVVLSQEFQDDKFNGSSLEVKQN